VSFSLRRSESGQINSGESCHTEGALDAHLLIGSESIGNGYQTKVGGNPLRENVRLKSTLFLWNPQIVHEPCLMGRGIWLFKGRPVTNATHKNKRHFAIDIASLVADYCLSDLGHLGTDTRLFYGRVMREESVSRQPPLDRGDGWRRTILFVVHEPS